VREAVESKAIHVEYIPTDDNLVDLFTKPLARPKFERFVDLVGLRAA
jgi:hypothetical protein